MLSSLSQSALLPASLNFASKLSKAKIFDVVLRDVNTELCLHLLQMRFGDRPGMSLFELAW